MKKSIIFLFALISLLSFASCNCCFNQNAETVNKFTTNDTGSHIELSEKNKLDIVLNANATTGYQWEIVNYDKSILQLVDSDYKVDSKLMGAPGKQIYTFKIIGKGNTDLKIIYHRSWEKDLKPAKVFELKITAK